MQSGAFIQLILTLAAIASRMYTFMPEIQEVLALGWAAGHRSLQALSPSCAHKLKPIGVHTNAELREILTSRPHKNNEFDDATHEDLGGSIARPACVLNVNQEVDAVSIGPGTPSTGFNDVATVSIDVPVLAENEAEWPSQAVVSHDASQLVDTNKPSIMKRERKFKLTNVPPVKRKRDEIDDIFGI